MPAIKLYQIRAITRRSISVCRTTEFVAMLLWGYRVGHIRIDGNVHDHTPSAPSPRLYLAAHRIAWISAFISDDRPTYGSAGAVRYREDRPRSRGAGFACQAS